MHEFTHYASNLHNRKDIDLDESKVDQVAHMMIDKNFGSQLLRPGPIRHDTWFDFSPEITKRGASILDDWQARFPILSKVMKHDPNSPTQVIINPSTGQPTTGVPTQPGGAGGAGPYQPIAPIEKPQDDENVGVSRHV